jgi:phenylalanine ammonia-lyase
MKVMHNSFVIHRNSFFDNPTTMGHLGKGTKVLYRFIREELRVPFHRGQVEDPVMSDTIDGRPVKMIGSWISVIYKAIRDGRLFGEVLKSMQEEANGVKLSSPLRSPRK